MNQITPHAIRVQSDTIPVTLDSEHEFTIPTAIVAMGYGVSPDAIRNHKRRHQDELIDGKHFISVTNSYAGRNEVEGKHWGVQNLDTLGGNQKSIIWTKRGIIRLGFFIKSERARLFRDAAEDLILRENSNPPAYWGEERVRLMDKVEIWQYRAEMNEKLADANARIIELLDARRPAPVAKISAIAGIEHPERDPKLIAAAIEYPRRIPSGRLNGLSVAFSRHPQTIRKYLNGIRGRIETLQLVSSDEEFGFTIPEDLLADAIGVPISTISDLEGERILVQLDDSSTEEHWTKQGAIEVANRIGTKRALDFAAACDVFEPNW